MSRRLAFPLISRRRLVGSPFGTRRSGRRGRGGETAGTRPYLPGDPIPSIEWAASARLSAAHGIDEFIVREPFDEQAPVVSIVLDERPSMTLYRPPSPWLDKTATAEIALRAIVASADEARAAVALFDRSARAPQLLEPGGGRTRLVLGRFAGAEFSGPPDALDDALARLLRSRRAIAAGSFVFVISDFLGSLSPASRASLGHVGADVVPVIAQDPTWERSFPDVPGVLLPLVDVETGAVRPVRLTRRETHAWRGAHERRYAELVQHFRAAGMDPVTLDDQSPEGVHRAFLGWATRRQRARRGGR